jgi:hypothetical protein
MKCYLLIFALLIACAAHCQKTRIQLNLSQGQVYRQVQESESRIAQTINGQEITTVMSLSGRTKSTVTAVHDSVYEIEVAYERLAFKQSTPQGESIIDSDNDSQDIMGSILHSVVNTPFNMIMSKSGRIIKVGSDTVFSTAINKVSTLNEEQKNQLSAQIFHISV